MSEPRLSWRIRLWVWKYKLAHRLGFHAYDDLEDEPDRLVSYCIWCHKAFVIRAKRKAPEEQPYDGPMYTA